MKPSEILIAAKALIDTPEKWTRREMARDLGGNPVRPDCDNATCFCGYGAVVRAAKYGYLHTLRLLDTVTSSNFPYWQDAPGRTHAEVMAAFDRAIELAKAEAEEAR